MGSLREGIEERKNKIIKQNDRPNKLNLKSKNDPGNIREPLHKFDICNIHFHQRRV